MESKYQICTRCIMDTTDPNIKFDENGVCNHCHEYESKAKKYVFALQEGQRKLKDITDRIKEQGKNREHDCLMGLSGGVDSTYVAYLSKKLGLRPLAVHLDNEWDTEIAVENINNIIKKLGFDLYTCAVSWDEFKDLQLAYLKASVVDIEAVTDHLLAAALYHIANEKGLKYILSGNNIVTEGIMPKSWQHNKNDLVNLKAIHSRFGTVELKSFPTLGLFKRISYQLIKGIQTISVLNYVPYVKKDVKKLLEQQIGWKDYGSKHYESIFTRFYQAYILPRKFNIDKRKAHLSTLICSGQITREEALKEMQKDLYPAEALKKDKEYVLKKLGLTDKEFERIMGLPIKSHYDYRSDVTMFKLLQFIYRIFNKG